MAEEIAADIDVNADGHGSCVAIRPARLPLDPNVSSFYNPAAKKPGTFRAKDLYLLVLRFRAERAAWRRPTGRARMLFC